MLTPRPISLETARKLAVYKQGLHRRPTEATSATLLEAIRRIGLLQLDSVSVVARSHYLVMLSRVGLYNRADLDALLAEERAVFEQWAHALCLVPREHYAWFAPVIHARRGEGAKSWGVDRLGPHPQALLDEVLAEITERGPLCSRDFRDPRPERGTWWDHKPAKHALNLLFNQGYLMTDRRVNFQIFYNLAERILPESAEPPHKTLAEFQRWAIQQSVHHLGVATEPQVRDYYRQKAAITRAALAELVADGTVTEVTVSSWDKPAFVLSADLPLIAALEEGQHQPEVTTFLTPFDNLTWNRDRLRDLFGFEYKLEIYVPQAQRIYGYYVMPILHRGRFVGRIDPKVDRKAKILHIHKLYLEPEVALTDELLTDLAEALDEFRQFHHCEQLQIAETEPGSVGQALGEVMSGKGISIG